MEEPPIDLTQLEEDSEKQFAIQEGQTSVRVVSWNAEGKGSPADIDHLLAHTLVTRQPDVVCLQQANLTCDQTEHYKWMCSGTSGSGVLVHKACPWVPLSFEQVSSEICVARLESKEGKTISVVSCYIPPASEYLCEESWAKLTDTLRNFQFKETFILVGDFNAQIGFKDLTKDDLSFVGKKLLHEVCDENGVRLKKLAVLARLRILSTFRTQGLETYRDGSFKSQRHFIICPAMRRPVALELHNDWIPEYKHAMHQGSILLYIDTKLFEVRADDETEIQCSSWNIQSATPAKIDQTLSLQKLSVVCLQELFLTSDEDIQTENYSWLSSKKLWAKNVGIVLRKSADITLNSFEPLSEFLCVANITYAGRLVTVMSCYVPQPSESQHDVVVAQIKQFIQDIPSGNIFVVGGYFCCTKQIYDVNAATVVIKKLLDRPELTTLAKLKRVPLTTATEKSVCQFLVHPKIAGNQAKPIIRILPFFENVIYGIRISKTVTLSALPTNTAKKTAKNEEEKVEIVNGAIHKIYQFHYPELEGEEFPSVISPELAADIKKFKNTKPSPEEVRGILKDFVWFHGPNRRSAVLPNPTFQVHNSFQRNELGKLEMQNICVYDANGDNLTKRMCRIKWKNITLAEMEGNKDEKVARLWKQTLKSLVHNLAQTCYTIKGKRSYFNKGLPPVLMGDPKLAGVLKVVTKDKVPTMEDVYKQIDDLKTKETDLELVFGPDFTQEERLFIKMHCQSHGLEHRLFSDHSDIPKKDFMEFIGVSKRFTAQYLRDMLKKEKGLQNVKYFLIPPCGIGNNPDAFYQQYVGENLKDENRLVIEYMTKDKVPQQPTKEPTKLQKGNQAKIPGLMDVKRTAPKPLLNTPNYPPGRNEPPRRGTGTSRLVGIREQRKIEREEKRGYPVKRPERQRYDDYTSDNWQQSSVNKSYTSFDEPARRQDNKSYTSFEEPARRQDNYGNYWQSESRNGSTSRVYDQPKRSHNDSWRFQELGGGSDPKRQRFGETTRDPVPRVNLPPWHNLQPLVLVWPITRESQLEYRPKNVLEANFPFEFEQGSNYAAAYVKLRLTNGQEKTYCLSVADRQHAAAEKALQLISKHCTIIKPQPGFLCDGTTPNFVRYKVPCQTNPRTYIILSSYETGALTPPILRELLETFVESFNEDVFFDKDGYSVAEKKLILDEAPKYNLSVRHFGDVPGMSQHYVCVYKQKPKQVILEEVLKMRGSHPKYMISTDRLPPHLGLGIF